MKLRILLYAFLGMSIIGCSSDDNLVEEPEEIQRANFKVIGENENSVFLFSYNGGIETSSTENLTDAIGVAPGYLTLRQVDNLLSFYSFSQGAFSLAQRDIVSGASANFDDFYTNGPERSIVWGTNDVNSVFFGYFTTSDNRDFAIQNVDLTNFESEDFIIDFNIETIFQPIQYDQKLFLSYRDALGNYKLTFFDTESKTVGPIVNFNNIPISILIDDIGDVVVIKNGANPTLEKYSSNALAFVSSSEFNFNSVFNPGPIDGVVFSDDKLFYARPFIQPARFAAGPAVFDLISQEDLTINLENIVNQANAEEGNITISAQRFSKQENVFLVAYSVFGEEIKGGVIEISAEGEFITNITFPFRPTFILED
jgi:hypothetical protein